MASPLSIVESRPVRSLFILIVLVLFSTTLCQAQNPVDPYLSYADILCDLTLITTPDGQGDPLGDLGLIVHCYDVMGEPIAGLPGSAFRIVNQTGTMVEFGSPDLAMIATDDQGRIFLTETLEASATLVHGSIEVVVSVGGQDVTIDNGGGGLPVEFRTADLNFNGSVDLVDITIFGAAFGCCEDTEACLQCDYDGDGCVSLTDHVIFSSLLYGKRNGAGVPLAKTTTSRSTALFAGCIQRDFDDDNDPSTLREEITLMPGEVFSLKLLAKDIACLSGVDFEMALPPSVSFFSISGLTPFRDLRQHPAPPGWIRATMTAPDISSGPVFMCQFMLQSTTGGLYSTDDFTFGDVLFADCAYPPNEVEACIGTPTPCDVSFLEQGSGHFISCPANDLSQNDIVTAVMRDQDGNPVPGLPAGDFRVYLHDDLGSGRADVFKMTPLAGTTDADGRLDFLFEPRATCRWPDACLDLGINVRYEGCSLDIDKFVQTLNVVRYDGVGQIDRIDDDDLDVFRMAKFSQDICLDLTHRYRCPVVTQASIDIVTAHLLHGCDVTDVPDLPGDASVWLEQNIPNPFNPTTVFRLNLPTPTKHALLEVYDLRGQTVCTIWSGPLPAGDSRFSWNGRDAGDRAVGSGVYLARLTALGQKSSIRMVLLR